MIAIRRRLAATIAALTLLAGCGAGPAGQEPDQLAPLRSAAGLERCPAGAGPGLPDVTLPCLGGGPDVPLTAPSPGRPMLVNVWATWCAPCVREVPELVELARDGAGRIDVLGVLTQDTPGNGLEFARQFGMRYPSVVDDNGTVMRAFSPGPPVTLFLDAGGRVQHVHRGELKDSATLRALVRQHLQVDVPAAAPATRASPRP